MSNKDKLLDHIKIWRPMNTYGLIFIGVISISVLTYAIIAL